LAGAAFLLIRSGHLRVVPFIQRAAGIFVGRDALAATLQHRLDNTEELVSLPAQRLICGHDISGAGI
jgi:hypothetical protein